MFLNAVWFQLHLNFQLTLCITSKMNWGQQSQGTKQHTIRSVREKAKHLCSVMFHKHCQSLLQTNFIRAPKQSGVVGQICSPSALEAEAEGVYNWVQLGPFKIKKDWVYSCVKDYPCYCKTRERDRDRGRENTKGMEEHRRNKRYHLFLILIPAD